MLALGQIWLRGQTKLCHQPMFSCLSSVNAPENGVVMPAGQCVVSCHEKSWFDTLTPVGHGVPPFVVSALQYFPASQYDRSCGVSAEHDCPSGQKPLKGSPAAFRLAMKRQAARSLVSG